jgi:predicted ATP-grasp superfamily ATP-dependent carboligase
LVVPETIVGDEKGNLDRPLRDLEYPAIIKPCIGHVWQRKGIVVRDIDDAERAINSSQIGGIRFLLQSFIPGPAQNLISVGVHLSTNGDLVSFAARKVRQTSGLVGVGTMMETTPANDALPSCLPFLECMKYHGIGELEFKLDERTGQYNFIEFNPRLWQQVNFASKAGIDFPWLAYSDLAGFRRPSPCPTASEKPLRWLDYFRDLDPALRECQARRLPIWQWLASVLSADSRPYFDWRDPMPFVWHAAHHMRLLALGAGRRVGRIGRISEAP